MAEADIPVAAIPLVGALPVHTLVAGTAAVDTQLGLVRMDTISGGCTSVLEEVGGQPLELEGPMFRTGRASCRQNLRKAQSRHPWCDSHPLGQSC
jgi:hypothetical protein